ncbi:MAG: hypothetical protein K6F20_04690 [Bacteroidaceae bacterium]|nr:hypothetical protein [Bacteroidaceae bacterium]
MKAKRIFSAFAMLLTYMAGANATDVITVSDVTVPKGGEVTLEIGSSFETSFNAFQLDIELADGLSLKTDGEGYVIAELGSSGTDHGFSVGKVGNVYSMTCVSASNRNLPEGAVLMRVTLQADASLEKGTVIPASVTNVVFSEKQGNDQIGHPLAGVNFNITIGEPSDGRTILDENSTTAPTSATGVNVRVKRAINANEWSTICLPFAMSEAQAKAAFGSDVQLADFTGWETTEYDASDNALAIDVTFSSVTAIEANHPYVIKVSSAVTEFTVDGVDIAPEDDPAVSVGKKSKGTLGSFTGSYVPTLIDEECLFLNSNKFWYSTGKTNMKGYRGYFYFQDVLAAYAASAPVKMKFTLDGTTGIEDVQSFNGSNIQDGEIYDLAGRRVEKAGKGIYIINNKKVLVK